MVGLLLGCSKAFINNVGSNFPHLAASSNMMFDCLARVLFCIRYCKIPIIRPGLIFIQKAFLLGLFSEGLVIRMYFAFQNRFSLSIETAKKTKMTA